MTDLPPYSGWPSRCRKCRAESAATLWVQPGAITPEGSRGECLQRECSRCGYVWQEAIADAPAVPEEPQ